MLYESLCPDSKNFMPHLEEVHNEFGEYIDVELVPFGKSSVSHVYYILAYTIFNYITQFVTSSPMQMERFSAASTDPESAREIVCRAAFSAAQKIKGHR